MCICTELTVDIPHNQAIVPGAWYAHRTDLLHRMENDSTVHPLLQAWSEQNAKRRAALRSVMDAVDSAATAIEFKKEYGELAQYLPEERQTLLSRASRAEVSPHSVMDALKSLGWKTPT